MSYLPPGLQVFPGQPVSNGHVLPAFQRLSVVNGDRYLIYATAGGIVFYTTSLDYVSTFPFPSEPAYGGSREHDEGCLGFDSDRNGDILLWKNRNAWVIRAEPTKNQRVERTAKVAPVYKLHSEIRSQHTICKAQLVKKTILLQFSQPNTSIEIWKLNSTLSLPVWERKAILELQAPAVSLVLSPCQAHLAYCQLDEPTVHIQSLNQHGQAAGLPQKLRHPGKEGVRGLSWRGREVSWRAEDVDPVDDSQPALFTFDARNTLRLYSPIVDAPNYFQLVFNFRLSALAIAETTHVRGRGRDITDPYTRRNHAYAPYTISSSGSGDEIYWMDRSHNIRSVRFEGFEAKPPSVLNVKGEKVWKLAQSSSDTMETGVVTQVVAVDAENHFALTAETDSTSGLTHLKRIDLELGGCRTAKRVFLGIGQAQDKVWREEELDRFITVSKQGVCGIWKMGGASPPSLTACLDLAIGARPVDAICLLDHCGPLVCSSGTILRTIDIATSELLWETDLQAREPKFRSLQNIRRLGNTGLLLTSDQGNTIQAIFEGSDGSPPRFQSYDPNPTASGAFRPLSDTEACRVVQAAGPLVLNEQDRDIITLVTDKGRLLWVRIEPEDRTIEQSLRVASETMDLLAVAGRRKAACVSDGELIIWDVEDAIYANAAEHVEPLPADVLSLSWSSYRDRLLLAVGTPRNIRVLFQGRIDSDQLNTAWSTLFEIDLGACSPHPLSDFTMMPGGHLVMCAGTQILTAGPTVADRERFDEGCTRLPDFHRFNLEQCLVWNHDGRVRDILARLDLALQGTQKYVALSPEDFWAAGTVSDVAYRQRDKDLLGEKRHITTDRPKAGESLSSLRENPFPFLSGQHLGSIGWSRKQIRGVERMATVLNVLDKEALRLDSFGKKYVSALYLRASGPSRPSVPFRYMVWALHSRRQTDLLRASTQYWEQDRLTWTEAKRMGTPFWLTDIEALRGHADEIARNEFLTSERDPISCSLLYFALDKKATVYGLWRQAYGHKEQQSMLKFLSNDFTQERWKGAALKNAYALLSKQRYHYAAAFFMLAGQARDAIRICLRQLDDLELAIMLARIADYRTAHPGLHAPTLLDLDKQAEERPVPVCGDLLREVIETTILPNAQKAGDRWLSHWGLWNLGQRATAIRHLCLPLRDVGIEPKDADNRVRGVLSGSADWMSLYYDLRRRYFETDTNAADNKNPLESDTWLTRAEEWDMVRHRSQRLWVMGFWSLSLAIIRDWKFVAVRLPKPRQTAEPTITARPEEKVPDTPSDVEQSSPLLDNATEDLPEKPSSKLSLFKENAVVVNSEQSQGAMEFDMSSFF